MCVYALQIFSDHPAKSALPPSDSKTLACVIFGPEGWWTKRNSWCACVCCLLVPTCLFFSLSLLFVDVCEPGTLCVFGSQISEWSPATTSKEGQRSRRILSQYGSRSYSSAAQRLATLSPFVRPAKDSSRVNNSAFKPINKAFFVCVPNTHI